jgi:T5orf172 domain
MKEPILNAPKHFNHVYIMKRSGDRRNLVKIGRTRVLNKTPEARIRQIGNSCGYKAELIHARQVRNSALIERLIHLVLANERKVMGCRFHAQYRRPTAWDRLVYPETDDSTGHKEWFAIDAEVAIRVMNVFADWNDPEKDDPYDPDGMLKSRWISAISSMSNFNNSCNPEHLDSKFACELWQATLASAPTEPLPETQPEVPLESLPVYLNAYPPGMPSEHFHGSITDSSVARHIPFRRTAHKRDRNDQSRSRKSLKLSTRFSSGSISSTGIKKKNVRRSKYVGRWIGHGRWHMSIFEVQISVGS